MRLIVATKKLKVLIFSIFLMVSRNNIRIVPGALAPMLLSVSMASVITMSLQHNLSAQGFSDGSETSLMMTIT